MDGHFVPNLTIGPPVVADLAKRVGPRDAFFDCHLSVNNPATLVPALAAAGASSITFHIEVVSGTAAVELCKTIRTLGMRAAVACKPSTACDISGVYDLVDAGLIDMVLCLSVEPGFGGQKFNPAVCEKVAALRARYPDLDIQMDGGVNPSTATLCARAGANVLVAGSAVFGAADPAQVISQLRQSIVDAS
jgi:ribulose-phosphate 3-epimerase